jgi:hypothetical protein
MRKWADFREISRKSDEIFAKTKIFVSTLFTTHPAAVRRWVGIQNKVFEATFLLKSDARGEYKIRFRMPP